MYKLNSMLWNYIRTCQQHVVGSLNAGGSILGNCAQRTVCSSAVRLQDAAPSVDTSTNTDTNANEFSYFPPLPGQDSSLRWAGKKFEELPVAHIKATYNNTHIQMTQCDGQSLIRTSCGTEGFRNAKKGTPIAAQTAGISAAAKAMEKGITFVRVVVKGLGPGRLSAIKGLTMGGLEIVSITDNTPVPHNGCRPRKARRM